MRHTVNDQSYMREKFCGLMGFVMMLGKLFAILLLFSYMIYYTAKSISREHFHNSSKIHENRESFLSFNFCRLRYIQCQFTMQACCELSNFCVVCHRISVQSPHTIAAILLHDITKNVSGTSLWISSIVTVWP